MGIVAKQSARNTVILITGLLLGAINTMFVLPKAFEGFEEGWGLIRIMTAWGTILAQILALGTPSAIIRFLPTAENKDRESSMLTLLCMLPAVAFAMVGVASSLASEDILLHLDADAGWLLSGRVGAFLFMALAYLAMMLLKAVLMHRLRTVVVTLIQEVWLKGTYLALAVIYLHGWMPFQTFFTRFLYSYAAAVVMMFVEARGCNVKMSMPQPQKDFRPFFEYGVFALLSSGSRVVAKNLDFVMVGALLGLATKEIDGGLLPTPVATDYKGRSGQKFQEKHGIRRIADVLTKIGDGMRLNPPFIEQLMGYPIGWTDLKH